ncbi:hypothetical protein F511_21652 [Dorcoceras hygrometricum]|uniref:Spindle pole body component 110-like n=1 Tax=Dorcoceras hygrometricum TaxID=472368 RepID=A0A2Z7CSK6_9LAMI|nr:hypothetical protein F511_21652 [Dorcoceras hygrometricum]
MFTREDLVNALNEMVYEYKKLSQTFEDVKAENECLKDKSYDASCLQLEDPDSLKTELSKLKTENEFLRSKSNELTSENERLKLVLSSWKKYSISLGKLHEVQKPFNDRTGLGFSSVESNSSDNNTQSYLTDDKLKIMSFVKASMIHKTLESVKYDDQIMSKMKHKGKSGIGYAEPENSKPSWLKNILEKDRARSGSQSSDLHQQRRSSVEQQQPDVAFLFAHQNDTASTNRNDVAALHQLIPNSIKTTNDWLRSTSKRRRKEYVSITANSRRNQQLVTIFLTTGTRRNPQNAAFQLIKTTSRCSHDWFLKPAAGHSAGTSPHNATTDNGTIQQSTPKG